MGLFRPYEQGKTDQADEAQGAKRKLSGSSAAPRPEQAQAAPAAEAARTGAKAAAVGSAARQPQKKGTRTPTRAEAEAARMARLHPTLSPKEQRKKEREAAREARMRNLDAAENLPERRLARDHVDARLTITEFMLPLMLGVMAVSLAFSRNPTVSLVCSGVMFGLFLLWILNIVVCWTGFKRLATERGLNPKQRGLMMYMVNRMMTIRSMRRPEARIARGESY